MLLLTFIIAVKDDSFMFNRMNIAAGCSAPYGTFLGGGCVVITKQLGVGFVIVCFDVYATCMGWNYSIL